MYIGRQEEEHGQHYFGTNLEVVDDEVNEPVPPSTLGSPENVKWTREMTKELNCHKWTDITPNEFGIHRIDSAQMWGHVPKEGELCCMYWTDVMTLC